MSLSFVNNTLSLSSQELDYVLQFCFVTDKMSKNLELAYIVSKTRFALNLMYQSLFLQLGDQRKV